MLDQKQVFHQQRRIRFLPIQQTIGQVSYLSTNPMQRPKGTILIIAEDRKITSFLTLLLAERYELITTASGEGGLRRFSQIDEIDLIFLEYELSDMEGLRVLRSIRKMDRIIPVVFITGNSQNLPASAAVKYGIFAHLTKPLEKSSVEGVVQRTCPNPSVSKSDVESVRDFIEKHFTDNITVKDVAASCKVGYRQIARKFKETYGCTIMEYVKRRRVEKAKKLLMARCLWSYDIAHLVGFSHPKTFCAAFKSLTGMTPGQFQKRMTSSVASKQPSQIPLPLQASGNVQQRFP